MHTLFATHSGKLIDFKNVSQNDISLCDIAHHLTNTQRMGGALPFGINYSVASHSINCMRAAEILYPGEVMLHRAALMHDATEAYLSDVVSGLKSCLHDYTRLENKIERLIQRKYNIHSFAQMFIDEIDKRIFVDEVLAFVPEQKQHLYLDNLPYEPLNLFKIEQDYPKFMTCAAFLNLCEELGIHDN